MRMERNNFGNARGKYSVQRVTEGNMILIGFTSRTLVFKKPFTDINCFFFCELFIFLKRFLFFKKKTIKNAIHNVSVEGLYLAGGR